MPDLFLQNVIAVIWDFDKTLIPEYMQKPIFEHYGIDGEAFWAEVDGLPERYRAQGITVFRDIAYLNHLITYAQVGKMPGLNNRVLAELGRKLVFYSGMPGFMAELKGSIEEHPEFKKYEITVEHYVVSNGLAAVIRGSAIKPYTDGIWGCEFIENPLPPGYLGQPRSGDGPGEVISQIGYAIDNTTKTRAIFEINKGTNKWPRIDVNASIAPEKRRVPFQNMIYVADGPSDVPVFSLVKERGGKTYAVYRSGSARELQQVDSLLRNGRVDAYGEANYESGSQTYMWLMLQAERIAKRIVDARENAVKTVVSDPPVHF
ncbi:MAG: haloacid dehalogenase-like hydrolase [Desulforudis sp.]|nr:HAD family hydrolase [Clostridia bacterium]MDQ7791211.1 HAD family hydrolase [Clostridia bacterium]RJX17752.1 MAG: haloacid dehalogenase-like hydrolase [Desulforudis sp.]